MLHKRLLAQANVSELCAWHEQALPAALCDRLKVLGLAAARMSDRLMRACFSGSRDRGKLFVQFTQVRAQFEKWASLDRLRRPVDPLVEQLAYVPLTERDTHLVATCVVRLANAAHARKMYRQLAVCAEWFESRWSVLGRAVYGIPASFIPLERVALSPRIRETNWRVPRSQLALRVLAHYSRRSKVGLDSVRSVVPANWGVQRSKSDFVTLFDLLHCLLGQVVETNCIELCADFAGNGFYTVAEAGDV